MTELDPLMDLYRRLTPVNVEALIRELGLEVIYCHMDQKISGMIEPRDDGFRIRINRSDHLFRQRFTLAHELGHWIYHSDLIGDGLGDDRLYHTSDVGRVYNTSVKRQHENQANAFAFWLLIPEDRLEHDLKSFSDQPDWAFLSQNYQVSVSALKAAARKIALRHQKNINKA
jgi:Zn-dependent peptidase ImmA (M78 family)